MTTTPHTDPAIIAQTIGRDFEKPKHRMPFFEDALIDFSTPRYVSEALNQLAVNNKPKTDK